MVGRRTPEREAGGSILTQVVVLYPLARYIYLQKVLVKPRKHWLHPDMTEKILTGTLSKNETKQIDTMQICRCLIKIYCYRYNYGKTTGNLIFMT